jgi:hypothetical protein
LVGREYLKSPKRNKEREKSVKSLNTGDIMKTTEQQKQKKIYNFAALIKRKEIKNDTRSKN